jgi:RNA-directed DNA polymerase
MASDQQLTLSLDHPEDEAVTGAREEHTPVSVKSLMERVVERDNLVAALHQVRRNKGGPGIDGMTVEKLGPHLKAHWPHLRAQLLAGKYQPQPVKRVLIPKSGGGARQLGIPTVVDRFIQQAILQILQPGWDRTFSHRMSTVEPVFANITCSKKLKRFSLRGKDKMQGQWQLFCLVHNIEKLMRYGEMAA